MEKQLVTYEGAPIRLFANFSTETLQARRDFHDLIQVMKSKHLQPRLLHPARLSFKMEVEIKSFPYKRRPEEYFSIKPAQQR